jgi:anti-sigma factor RsiW
MRPPVTEAELHAYVDGALTSARAAEVEAYLSEHPEDTARIAAYREQIAALRREYDPALNEQLPPRFEVLKRAGMRPMLRYAAVAAVFVLGAVVGWQLHAYNTDRLAESTSWARRAAIAHVVYSPEVRHPVEVGADQEAHLVAWLSKRLGSPLKVPHLGGLGYALVGGRLLPGERGPVAQFMYQDGRGQRLTLYVRVNPDDSRETAFRFAQERGIGVFYWLDRKLGYALSGEVDKPELLRVATAVYRLLNP